MNTTKGQQSSWKGLYEWRPLKTLPSLKYSRRELGKVAESKRKCIHWTHKGVLRQCHCGRRPHQLLGATKGIHYHKEFHSRVLRSLSSISANLCTIWWQIELSWAYGGFLKKKSMNTIPFNAEMRTLAYVMIHNLYLVTNLTTLSKPRTIFLYVVFTHKEIDICGHIYHLLTKSVTKRNSRTILPFPSLIIGLIAKTKLKIPSGLTIVRRDYPIGTHTVTQSKAHIRIKNRHFSNPMRWCWGRRWGYGGRNW